MEYHFPFLSETMAFGMAILNKKFGLDAYFCSSFIPSKYEGDKYSFLDITKKVFSVLGD